MKQKFIVLLVLISSVCFANAQNKQAVNIQLAEPTHEDPVSVGATIIDERKKMKR